MIISFMDHLKQNSYEVNSDNPIITHYKNSIISICNENEINNKMCYISILAERISKEYKKEKNISCSKVWEFISSKSHNLYL